MTVRNVLKGLMNKYRLEEINIIQPDKVVYSGTVDGWKTTSVDMILYKKEIEKCEVFDRLIFNNRKAFLFIAPIGAFYPTPQETDDFEPITHFFQD